MLVRDLVDPVELIFPLVPLGLELHKYHKFVFAANKHKLSIVFIVAVLRTSDLKEQRMEWDRGKKKENLVLKKQLMWTPVFLNLWI